MAPFVPLADGAQVEIVFVLAGRVVENRLWFTFDNPPFTLPDLQGLADGVYAWHTSELLPYLSSDLQLAVVEAFDWTATPPPLIAAAGPPVNAGTSSKSYSANVAVRVNLKWPLGFRERMNCQFVPGIPDSGVTLNTLDPLFASRVWSAYADLIDATRLFSPAFNWRWVVTSQVLHGVLRTQQLAGECEGPVSVGKLKLGQRRKRLG